MSCRVTLACAGKHQTLMWVLGTAGTNTRLPYFVLIPEGDGFRAEHVSEWFTFRPDIKCASRRQPKQQAFYKLKQLS